MTKIVLTSVFLSTLALPALATSSLSKCQGSTKHHSLTLQQGAGAVEARLDDRNFYRFNPIEVPKGRSYSLLSKQSNIMQLQGISLSELMKNKDTALELCLALVLQRPELEEEKDMLYFRAAELLESLRCR